MNRRGSRGEDPVYGCGAWADEVTIRAVSRSRRRDALRPDRRARHLRETERRSQRRRRGPHALAVRRTDGGGAARRAGRRGGRLRDRLRHLLELRVQGRDLDRGHLRAAGEPQGGHRAGAFRGVAALALERGLPRVEWAALDWNELALGFYDRLGARRMSEWRMLRLEGEPLARLGAELARRELRPELAEAGEEQFAPVPATPRPTRFRRPGAASRRSRGSRRGPPAAPWRPHASPRPRGPGSRL